MLQLKWSASQSWNITANSFWQQLVVVRRKSNKGIEGPSYHHVTSKVQPPDIRPRAGHEAASPVPTTLTEHLPAPGIRPVNKRQLQRRPWAWPRATVNPALSLGFKLCLLRSYSSPARAQWARAHSLRRRVLSKLYLFVRFALRRRFSRSPSIHGVLCMSSREPALKTRAGVRALRVSRLSIPCRLALSTF